MGIPWTADRTAELRRLFANGYGDEEIASALGVSRHAVIGKRYRLELFRISRDQGDAYHMAVRRSMKERAVAGQ